MTRIFSLLLLAGWLYSCNQGTPKSDEAKTTEATQKTQEQIQQENQAVSYKVDVKETKVGWLGSKRVGDQHTGTLSIQQGEVQVKNNILVGGNFIIDMNSLVNKDISDVGEKNNLINHLKSPDFFDVQKYPEAKFVITQVKPWNSNDPVRKEEIDPNFSILDPTHRITGNLTLKGVTKGVTFPAQSNHY